MITLKEFFSFRLKVVEGFCWSVSNFRQQYSLGPTRALPPRGLGDKGEKIIYFKGAKILISRINIREQGILLKSGRQAWSKRNTNLLLLINSVNFFFVPLYKLEGEVAVKTFIWKLVGFCECFQNTPVVIIYLFYSFSRVKRWRWLPLELALASIIANWMKLLMAKQKM